MQPHILVLGTCPIPVLDYKIYSVMKKCEVKLCHIYPNWCFLSRHTDTVFLYEWQRGTGATSQCAASVSTCVDKWGGSALVVLLCFVFKRSLAFTLHQKATWDSDCSGIKVIMRSPDLPAWATANQQSAVVLLPNSAHAEMGQSVCKGKYWRLWDWTLRWERRTCLYTLIVDMMEMKDYFFLMLIHPAK